jgi:peptidoglycan/LPS O-acetylase OafA/YrhL
MPIVILLLVLVVGALALERKRTALMLTIVSFVALTLHTFWPGSGITQARYEQVQFVLIALLPGLALVLLSSERFGSGLAAGTMRALLFVVAVLGASNLLHELGLFWWGVPGSMGGKLVRMLLETVCCVGMMVAVRMAVPRLVGRSRV